MNEFVGKSCCFTGHRKMHQSESTVYKSLYNRLENLIFCHNVLDFYNGGAIGFDTVAALAVINFKKMNPNKNVRLNMVLPCCKEDQTNRWASFQIERYDYIISQADHVMYTSDKYFKGCMKKRNEALVELGHDYCLCYVDERKFKSGASQTLRMARRNGVNIVNLYEPATAIAMSIDF